MARPAVRFLLAGLAAGGTLAAFVVGAGLAVQTAVEPPPGPSSGTLVVALGPDVEGVRCHLYEAEGWRLLRAWDRRAEAGACRFAGLPAGAYHVEAVDDRPIVPFGERFWGAAVAVAAPGEHVLGRPAPRAESVAFEEGPRAGQTFVATLRLASGERGPAAVVVRCLWQAGGEAIHEATSAVLVLAPDAPREHRCEVEPSLSSLGEELRLGYEVRTLYAGTDGGVTKTTDAGWASAGTVSPPG